MQCIQGESRSNIAKIILTASGGPFRTWPLEKLKDITVADALNHPTWNMGRKITVDSATMMNKGFEVIEAYWLFDMEPDRIEVVIHPQSIVHSLIETIDGSLLAQLGPADMKLPIQYALSYPERLPRSIGHFSLKQINELRFEEVDYRRYPCLQLALQALRAGGVKPAALNVANDLCVAAFLDNRLRFTDIAPIIEQTLEQVTEQPLTSIDELTEFIVEVERTVTATLATVTG
jgi:1-deoxy-D-xylulose-5-phosphate reductoisomerase